MDAKEPYKLVLACLIDYHVNYATHVTINCSYYNTSISNVLKLQISTVLKLHIMLSVNGTGHSKLSCLECLLLFLKELLLTIC